MNMMTPLNEVSRLVGVLVLAGGSLLGCASTANEGVGSEQHFFGCRKDAECTHQDGPCVAKEEHCALAVRTCKVDAECKNNEGPCVAGSCSIAIQAVAPPGDASMGGGMGTGGSSATGGAGGSGGGAQSGCPTNLAGPKLVQISAPQGGKYCMDATEVTNDQYAQFLAAKANGLDVSGQDAVCKWNIDYTPYTCGDRGDLGPCAGIATRPSPLVTGATYPVVDVDWCDAFAYCKWAGKHLCGKIGGGANAFADYGDARKSEWFNACSKGGTRAFPYGDTYSATACNVCPDGTTCYNLSTPTPVAAGSMATCEGGFSGLFDLSGNVLEWEDSCNGTTGEHDACRPRGGSFNVALADGGIADLACGFDYFHHTPTDVSRGSRYSDVGFRCCATSP
jgi:formylglycine-generating enzyme required for sulfatase activity